MKKEAVWGAAAPRMRTMLAGLLTNSCTWLKKLPARKVAKKMVSTCTGTLQVTCRVPAKHVPKTSCTWHRGKGKLPQGRRGAYLSTTLLVQNVLF